MLEFKVSTDELAGPAHRQMVAIKGLLMSLGSEGVDLESCQSRRRPMCPNRQRRLLGDLNCLQR